MSQVHYEEITYKSALNRVKGMPFRWSLNPYKGCVHGCHYCFARRFHAYLDLNPGSDWTSVIFAKVNVAWVLRRELRRPSWKREEVAVGTATDPYQPIEGKHQLTRQCLIAFADAHNPISLVTKGTMIVRDTDVLAELSETAGCTVVFSVTTLDRDLWRRIEPGTPPPEKRLWAMERLVEAGVRAGVMVAPVIPGLTDGRQNLETVVRAAADQGAKFLGTQPLYLKPGTKEHFLGFLDAEYPQLLARYRQLYPGAYAPKRFQWEIRDRVSEIKRDTGLRDRRPGHTKAPPQLALTL